MTFWTDRLSRWFLSLLGLFSGTATIGFIAINVDDPLHIAVVEGGFALVLAGGLILVGYRNYASTDIPETDARPVALGTAAGFGLLLVMNLWFRALESAFGPVEARFAAVTSLTAGMLGGALVGIAVARQRRAYVAREAALEDYRVIFEEVEDAILVHDAESFAIQDANQQAVEVTGYTVEEMQERGVMDIIAAHPEVGPEQAKRKLENRPDRETTWSEWPIVRKDGTERWLEVRLTDASVRNGAVILAVVRDITERRERQAELRRYETLIDRMPDSVFMFDTEEVCIYANPAAVKASRFSEDEILGKPVASLLAPGVVDEDRREEILDAYSTVRDGDRVAFRETISFDTPDGTVHVDANTFRADAETGEFHGVVTVLREITQRVETERELHRQNERLTEFANIVSHDLRNPLNVAKGHLTVVSEECESDHIEPIERAHDRMEALIEDLLQHARQGDEIQTPVPVELSEAARAAWRTVETKDASLRVETEHTVRADDQRLCQLFENLVRNAVEHGGEDVTVTVGELDNGFYVSDDGEGLTATEPQKVFESGYTTSSDGTGFGLDIVTQIIDAHGWTIRATEGDEGGARFDITGVTVLS